MNPLISLARPEIVALKPYAHAAWLPSLIRMHANEAPWRPSGDIASPGSTATLNRNLRRSSPVWRRCTAYPPRKFSRHAAPTKPSMFVADLFAGRHRRNYAMRSYVRHVPGCGADPGRGGDRAFTRARTRLEHRPGAAAGSMAPPRQIGVLVLAEQSDRQSHETEPPSSTSARRSTARPSSSWTKHISSGPAPRAWRHGWSAFKHLLFCAPCPKRMHLPGHASARCSLHPN